MDALIVIPARYESNRLPGKPLVRIAGETLIRRTYLRCLEAVPADQIVVATDDTRIVDHCHETGMGVILTSDRCLTGTDRVAEVAERIAADIYINVQGDEPLCNPADIHAMIAAIARHPGEIINGYCAIDTEEQYRSVSVPKTVFAPDGRLLYMSRGPLPGNKLLTFQKAWRQVCIYAFPADALAAFTRAPGKTPLEAMEDIEILRFLELGFNVRMIEMSSESIAVDHPEDVFAVERALVERGLR